LRNISGAPVDLFTDFGDDGTHPWSLGGGVSFNFSLSTTMAAGGFLVVVNFDPSTNAAALAQFRAIYGVSASVPVVGPYLGSLSNFSDTVQLRKPDTPEPGFVPQIVVDQVEYSDFGAWPSQPDGLGPSLERRSKNQLGSLPSNWGANRWNAATPGRMNSLSDEIPAVTTWGFVSLCGALLTAGTIIVRRSQTAR
jgi:hypothetical protein